MRLRARQLPTEVRIPWIVSINAWPVLAGSGPDRRRDKTCVTKRFGWVKSRSGVPCYTQLVARCGPVLRVEVPPAGQAVTHLHVVVGITSGPVRTSQWSQECQALVSQISDKPYRGA